MGFGFIIFLVVAGLLFNWFGEYLRPNSTKTKSKSWEEWMKEIDDLFDQDERKSHPLPSSTWSNWDHQEKVPEPKPVVTPLLTSKEKSTVFDRANAAPKRTEPKIESDPLTISHTKPPLLRSTKKKRPSMNRKQLRQGIILREILGPPRSIQPYQIKKRNY